VVIQAALDPECVQTKQDLIRRNLVLSKLDESGICLLAESGRWKSYAKGDVVWNLGSEVEWFGLIQAGFVKMVKFNEDGRETTLEIMGAGQTFGCLGTVEGSGCPLVAVAVTNLNLLRLPKQDFLVQYENSVGLQKEIMKVSTRRLFAKLSMMAKLTTGRVDSRIANVLLMLSESYGIESPQGLTINVPLTRQDLSDFTGITIESAIRTLSKWQKAKTIESQNSNITILDLDAIEAIARSS